MRDGFFFAQTGANTREIPLPGPIFEIIHRREACIGFFLGAKKNKFHRVEPADETGKKERDDDPAGFKRKANPGISIAYAVTPAAGTLVPVAETTVSFTKPVVRRE